MNEQKGTIDLLYYEGYDADCGVPCRIRLCRDQIRICWEEESDIGPGSQEVEYLGEDRGHGHYELHCPDRNGKATLHGFPGARLLVGDLIENNLRQMWRVNLFSDGTGDDE
jgi:hypothetical protein